MALRQRLASLSARGMRRRLSKGRSSLRKHSLRSLSDVSVAVRTVFLRFGQTNQARFSFFCSTPEQLLYLDIGSSGRRFVGTRFVIGALPARAFGPLGVFGSRAIDMFSTAGGAAHSCGFVAL